MEKKLFIMDIDGTLAVGSRLLPGAADLIAEIRRQGGRCCFFTNNSSRGIAEYQEKFRVWGIATEKEEFLTAGTYAIHRLKQRFGGQKIYVQGTRAFLAECRREGLAVTENDEDGIAAVLSTYDRELTYEKITRTCQVLEQHGVPWYATNADAACPCEFGMVPDCAAICAMISRAVGRSPEYLGKPDAGMAQYALERFGCKKEEALVIGDRLYTDIACGENAGIDTCLVLTGEEKEFSKRATYCVESVAEIARGFGKMWIAEESVSEDCCEKSEGMAGKLREQVPGEKMSEDRCEKSMWMMKKKNQKESAVSECYRVQKALETPESACEKSERQGQRWYKGDLHIHTTASDGHSTPEEMSLRAERQGLDYYAVTDHNYWHRGWPESSALVLPGIEITTESGHMNLFGYGPFLLSLNHPYLSKWRWKIPELAFASLDCLEIDNNPTLAYEAGLGAAQANRMAVQLSDLLWADGYRICAVGGSDAHLKEKERYGESPYASRPGEPATWLYLDKRSAEEVQKALKSCHAYVTRRCSIHFSCRLYDEERKEISGNWIFGDQLPENVRFLRYRLRMIDEMEAEETSASSESDKKLLEETENFGGKRIPDRTAKYVETDADVKHRIGREYIPDKMENGKGRKRRITAYVLINGTRQPLQKKATQEPERAEETGASQLCFEGEFVLGEAPYVWIRFGAEDENGDLVFYTNPFTRGEKKNHEYLVFGDVPERAVSIE